MRVRGIALASTSFLLGALVVISTPATGAGDPSVVHFTAAADYGSLTQTDSVLDLINTTDPDLNIAVGDLSYAATGSEQAWCDRVTSRVGPGFPFELLSGNHESNGLNGNINDFSACLPNQLPGHKSDDVARQSLADGAGRADQLAGQRHRFDRSPASLGIGRAAALPVEFGDECTDRRPNRRSGGPPHGLTPH